MSEQRRWRALIYNRASSDAAGQAVSVESQDVENRAWCDRQGWEIAGTITDNDRSATRFATKQREGFKTIWSGLDDGRWGPVDVLVTWASSRNQRRLDGYVDLRELCVKHAVRLAYKGRIYDLSVGADRFQTGLDALLDERDAEEIRDGILRSHRASVAAGRPRGSIPYGYTRTYLPGLRRIGQQVPDPETAAVVRGIVDDLLAGATLYAVAQRLNRDGAPTPQQVRDARRGRRVGRPGWSASMIRNLLAKPSLAGVRTHRGVPKGQGTWEPIIPPAVWREVQQILADPNRVNHHGGRDVAWLLSGIATCGVCGAWLRPMRHSGRMMYVCAGHTPTAPKGHVARAQEPLDAFITVAVVTRLSRPDALAAFTTPQVSDSRSAALGRELSDAKAQLAESVALTGQGKISPGSFALIEAQLAARIGELEARLAPPVQLPAVVRDMVGPDAGARWEHLDLAARRLIVRTLLEVTVLPVTQRGRRGFDPSLVRLDWRG